MTRDEMHAYACYERLATVFLRLMLWGSMGFAAALFLLCFLYIDFFTVNTTPIKSYVIWGAIAVISVLRCRYVLKEEREYHKSLMKPFSKVFDKKI